MNSAQRPPKSTVCRYALLLLLVLLPVFQAVAQSTTTTVTSSQSTITLGDTVTFTATVTTASGTPTGLVTFFDGATPLGSGTLALVLGNDQATFSTSLLSTSGSPHSITAIYQGDINFTSSTSAAISQTVNPRSSTSGVVLNPATVVAGQPSTVTATVTDGGTSTPPGTPDTFAATGAPATGRTGFTSTLFGNGSVLVAGGTNGVGTVLQSAEIYSVSGAAFTATGNLNTARTGAAAVLLPNGKILVAGGSSDGTVTGALNTAELFDPNVGTFIAAGTNMIAARLGATATLLNNGQVLVAGGANSGGLLNSAELYDPVANTFTATGNLNTARTGATATLLGSGQVLIAGGSSDGTVNGALNTAELFNAGAFTPIGSLLSAPRWQAAAALLLNGNVLIAGGQNSGGALTSADLYNPVANTFSASAHQMAQARVNGAAVALPNGMVLLAGGVTPASTVAELYDANSDKFDSTGSLQQSDNGLVATLLNNGQVLAVGLTSGGTPTSDAELYSPSFNPLGTVGLGSSEGTDAFGGPCVLTPSTSTASTCTSTVTASNVATNPHTITGTYPADAVHSGSSNTASLTVNQAATSTTVVSSSNPSVFGQSVTFTATVSAVAPGAGTPTGTVAFLDGASQIGTGTLLGGIATFATSALAVGNHTITTSYGGDANFTGSTGSLTGNPQVVNKANTATTVTSSQNPAALGQSVTFMATVSAAAPGSGTPTGTVNFLDGASTIGSGTLSGGVTTFTTSSLTAGNHTITTSYGGDGNFNGSTGSLTGNPQVIIAPPGIAKGFNPSGIQPNGTSTLTITITNPAANTAALQGVAFTDNLPTNVVVATTPGLSNTCGGTATAAAGSGTVSLTGGTVAVSSSCAVSVSVTSAATGSYLNTTGPVSSTNGGTGGSASATLSVAFPPTISKLFLPDTIPVTATTLLSFTINNPNSNSVPPNSDMTLTGIAFTDALPAGVVVANPNNLNNNCDGTVTAVPGSSTITLTGGDLGPAVGLSPRRKPTASRLKGPLQPSSSGSCFISVEVQATTTGTKNNTTGAISANESGAGATSNTATLTVTAAPTVAPPTIAKAFGASSIPLNGTTSLTLTLGNPNSSTIFNNVSVDDPLPSGLVVASPNGLSGSCLADGATVVANPGSSDVNVVGTTLTANTSCTVTVNVTGATSGVKNNTTGNVSATFAFGDVDDFIQGGTASASILVVLPPVIAKAFTPSSIALSQTTSLGFTITNPAANPVALTGVGFTDVLQTGLTVVNGSSAACGGTLTISGGNTISLSGATIAVNSSCTFSVTVTPTQFGNYTNSTSNVTSANGGAGNAATASLTVFPVVISPGSVNFGDVDSQRTVTTTVTISNNGNAAVSLSISLTPGTGSSANNFTFSTRCPSSLGAHTSCTVTVTFTAPQVTSTSQLGVSTATLKVASAGFTQNVPLSANVIDPEPQFTPGSLSFGAHTVNTSTTLTTTLKNVGLSALNIAGFTITGNHPGDFTFQSFCPASLAPANTCNINVTFTPKATGNRDAKLNLIGNDELEFVPIQGTGQ